MTIHPIVSTHPLLGPEVRLTQAAEGLHRRAFTITDVEQMVESGVIGLDERIELIGGELVPMSPKGIKHERLKQRLNEQLVQTLPVAFAVIQETTFRLSLDTYVEPDFIVYDRELGLEGLNGETALLSIEIADSSLPYDKGRKASIMAAFGVREYWVIDADRLTVTVHREPTPTGYRWVVERERGAELRPTLIDGFMLSIDDIKA